MSRPLQVTKQMSAFVACSFQASRVKVLLFWVAPRHDSSHGGLGMPLRRSRPLLLALIAAAACNAPGSSSTSSGQNQGAASAAPNGRFVAPVLHGRAHTTAPRARKTTCAREADAVTFFGAAGTGPPTTLLPLRRARLPWLALARPSSSRPAPTCGPTSSRCQAPSRSSAVPVPGLIHP